MKIVYQADDNGFYVGTTEADKSPLEPGVWLIPAGCTEIAPPDLAEGEAARWDGQKWHIVEIIDEPDHAPQIEPKDESPSGLKSYAAAKRFSFETGGILVAGSPIATDRDSQSMISNAVAYLAASGAEEIMFKSPAGFVTLSAATLQVIALAVGAHVQTCFSTEAEISQKINAEEITTQVEIDDFWIKREKL